MLFIGRRRCLAQMIKIIILAIIVVSCFIFLNILCITTVCQVSVSSNSALKDFGDVIAQGNVLPAQTNTQTNKRYHFVADNDGGEKTTELNVQRRLQLRNLTSLNICQKEQQFKTNTTLLAGRRSPHEKRYLVIGIPSVARESTSYLNTTLTSIFSAIYKDEEKHVSIVVLMGDFDIKAKQKQVAYFSNNFMKYLENGMLQFITAPTEYYEPLKELRMTLNDEMTRVMWRSKQALDFAYLMCYSGALSKYYLQLEDDVLASPSFVSKIIDFITVHNKNWLSLNVAHLGYIGKLYPAREVKNLASFIYLFFNDMPVDWLEPRWKTYRGHDPSKTIKRIASLFQHIGLHSSFKYNEAQRLNYLKEPHFDAFDHKYRGRNPLARITSDLKPSVGSALNAYRKGDGYFWGVCASGGSKVYNISFHKPVDLRRVVVNTGANFAPTNIILKGEVRISNNVDDTSKYCIHFMTVGEFRLGQIDIQQHHENVKCIQIKIIYQGRPILIREVNVWVD